MGRVCDVVWCGGRRLGSRHREGRARFASFRIVEAESVDIPFAFQAPIVGRKARGTEKSKRIETDLLGSKYTFRGDVELDGSEKMEAIMDGDKGSLGL